MKFRIKYWTLAVTGLYGYYAVSMMAAKEERPHIPEFFLCASDSQQNRLLSKIRL